MFTKKRVIGKVEKQKYFRHKKNAVKVINIRIGLHTLTTNQKR